MNAGRTVTVPTAHGPAEWLHIRVDQGPLSEQDRSVSVVVELCNASLRIEAVVTDWGVSW